MFLETSALTGENVEEGFLKCARTILNKIDSGTAPLFVKEVGHLCEQNTDIFTHDHCACVHETLGICT